MVDITWHINNQSYYSDRKAADLAKAIRAECAVPPEYEAVYVDEYTMLLIATEGVEFDLTLARKPLREFKAFLETWENLPLEEVWEYRLRLPYIVLTAWRNAWSEAQSLFDPDPVELPIEALTLKQKEEAATPGSPLATPAATLPDG
jgi:hypothetical protein